MDGSAISSAGTSTIESIPRHLSLPGRETDYHQVTEIPIFGSNCRRPTSAPSACDPRNAFGDGQCDISTGSDC
jgi:hypothetical protein